jgi:hypothetical protein
MLASLKPGPDFSRGCAGRKIGIHLSRPTPYTVIRRWFYVSPAWPVALAEANLYSLVQYLVPGNKPQGKNRLLAGCRVMGLCRMLDMDFGEFLY